MTMRSLWLARDKDGDLFLSSVKPTRDNTSGTFGTKIITDKDDEIFINAFSFLEEPLKQCFVELSRDAFPEVTWENSPVELTLNLKTKK